MNVKKFALGTIAGGVAFFLLGFIVYALLLEDFYAGHTVKGVMKSEEEMKYYPLFLGNVAQGALLTYVFLVWAKIKTFSQGVTAGGIIGFFMTAGFNLVTYDTTRLMSAAGTITDIFVFAAVSSLAGGVIGVVLGMGKD